jgi:hypothetical protein
MVPHHHQLELGKIIPKCDIKIPSGPGVKEKSSKSSYMTKRRVLDNQRMNSSPSGDLDTIVDNFRICSPRNPTSSFGTPNCSCKVCGSGSGSSTGSGFHKASFSPF